MPITKGNMFKQLLKKEWDMVKAETYFVLAATLTVNLAVVVFNIEQVAPLYAFVLMAPFLVPLYSAVQLFRREWSEGSIYLLLSLPINGGPIFLTKLLAILLEFIVQVAGSFGITFLFVYLFQVADKVDPRWALNFVFSERGYLIIQATVISWLILLGGMALLASALFLSQSLGRLVSKYRGLVTFISFLALLWLAGKTTIVSTANYVFNFADFSSFSPPKWPVASTSFFILMETLITAAYITATAYIYNTKLEL